MDKNSLKNNFKLSSDYILNMETILATTTKIYSYKFSKRNWERIAHSLKPKEKTFKTAIWSDYKYHDTIDFTVCVVTN